MAQTLLTASVDEEDKAQFDTFCSYVNDPFYSPANMQYVQKSVRELRDGKGHAHPLIEVDDE